MPQELEIGEPKSLIELAQRMTEDGFNESQITIGKGILSYKEIYPFREYADDTYANCRVIETHSWRDKSGKLKHKVRYSIISHYCNDDGTPDLDSIYKASNDAADMFHFFADEYSRFRRLIQHSEYLFFEGMKAFEKSVEESLVKNSDLT
jgi:hypothetical protein